MNNKKQKIKNWMRDFAQGMAIGVSCIIPGMSGGTMAALLRVFDKMIEAINSIFKHFGKSFMILLPYILGAAVAISIAVFPIKWASNNIPLPLVCLFAGLIIGGIWDLFPMVKKRPNISGILAFILSGALIIGLCFIPNMGNYDLSNISFLTVILLLCIGFVASCALVVPGVSGAMLMLIFGFYKPIVLEILPNIIKFGPSFGHDLAILGIFAIGVVLGFLVVSKIIGFFLKKYEYQSYMSIIGFIIGSLFVLFYQFSPNYPGISLTMFTDIMPKWGQIVLAAALLLVGLALALLLIHIGKRKENTIADTTSIEAPKTSEEKIA
jgi:putative membrane protein